MALIASRVVVVTRNAVGSATAGTVAELPADPGVLDHVLGVAPAPHDAMGDGEQPAATAPPLLSRRVPAAMSFGLLGSVIGAAVDMRRSCGDHAPFRVSDDPSSEPAGDAADRWDVDTPSRVTVRRLRAVAEVMLVSQRDE